MAQCNGLALSQQLSQVCLHTPRNSNLQEEHASQTSSDAVEQENPLEHICSQDFFCTPDFITPIEQQFSVDLENKENAGWLQSPRGLTPLRMKRPRPDTIKRLPVCLDNCAPDRCQEVVPFSEVPILPDGQLPGISTAGRNLKAHGVSQLNIIPSNSRGVLPTMRRRVQSPVCVRNPFLEDKKSQYRVPMPLFGQNNFPRYREDFHEIQEIGHGNFSRVFKVLNRIDGCLYAVKRSHHPLRMPGERKQALAEVQALAAVGAHDNVVRYHTAWFESDYCYIQTELCDGTLTQLRDADSTISLECSLLEIMRQMATALDFIHSKGVVHLDLKPDNIYVLKGVYKLGDFGRATRADGSLSIEEGDARYMPLEILNDDYTQLPKVDMFALGATIYEMARRSPLPSSGPNFQALRQGKLTLLPSCSLSFQNILKALMNQNARLRPTAHDLLKHSIFQRDGPNASKCEVEANSS